MPHNNNRSRHGNDRKRDGHTIITEEPGTLETKDAFNSYTKIKVPSTIFITPIAMSSDPKGNRNKRARTSGDDTNGNVDESCSITNNDEIPGWAKQLLDKFDVLTNQVAGLETLIHADRCASKPYYDKFFDKLCVQQQYEEPVTSEPTHSVLKIQEKDGLWKCVVVTSAHLLNSYGKAPGTDYLFVKLPRLIYEAGVESVLLHEQITNARKNTSVAYADVMVVVLRGIPEIEGRRSTMEELQVYPMDSVPYLPSWRRMDIVGRSRRDFVTGRSVVRVEKDGNYHYEFIANSGEKGDSGTILYVTTEDKKKQLVGIYKGTRHEEHLNSRGFITPAIGHSQLVRSPVVSCVLPERLDIIYGGKNKIKYSFRNTVNLEKGQCKLVYKAKERAEEVEVFGTLIKVPRDMESSFLEPYNSLPLDDAIDDVIDEENDNP